MMDRGDLVELAPHYAAMLVLTFLALGYVRAFFPGLALWQRFGVVLLFVFAYRPVVQRLGIGPSAWERDSDEDIDLGAEPDAETSAGTDADADAGTDPDRDASTE